MLVYVVQVTVPNGSTKGEWSSTVFFYGISPLIWKATLVKNWFWVKGFSPKFTMSAKDETFYIYPVLKDITYVTFCKCGFQ